MSITYVKFRFFASSCIILNTRPEYSWTCPVSLVFIICHGGYYKKEKTNAWFKEILISRSPVNHDMTCPKKTKLKHFCNTTQNALSESRFVHGKSWSVESFLGSRVWYAEKDNQNCENRLLSANLPFVSMWLSDVDLETQFPKLRRTTLSTMYNCHTSLGHSD